MGSRRFAGAVEVAAGRVCSSRRMAALARGFARTIAHTPCSHTPLCEERVVPQVVFVLGGPGAGKSTQSARVLRNFDGWAHISAGDCLREEKDDPNSKDGQLIKSLIDCGNFVPVAITVRLLQKAMTKHINEGKRNFLVDGYPRNMDNVIGWRDVIADSALVRGVLFLNCREEVMETRLLERAATSGRVDDHPDVIRKRFAAFVRESVPILDLYRQGSILDGKVFDIDGNPPIEDVWLHVEAAIKEIEAHEVQPCRA